MNRYGRLAMDHMANWLPSRYRQIEDPQTYFADLGEDMARRIRQVWFATTPPIPGETPEEATRRAVRNYRSAQRQVLGESAWPAPEADWSEESEVRTDGEGAASGGPPGWAPEDLDEEMDSDWEEMAAQLGLATSP